MISFAINIKDSLSELKKISVEQFFKSTLNPKEDTKQKILLLRNILSIDENKYRALKTKLPYVCCAIFNPPIRRTENFAFTQYFILDLDHLLSKKLKIDSLKQTISEDSRVVCVFNSPSNDGLKIMFKLKEKCYDAVKYSIFYKLFAEKFANQYGLYQVIDTKTSDATRACFVSHDNKAFFNNNAEFVDTEKYINFDNYLEVESVNAHFSQKEDSKNEQDVKIEEKQIPLDVFDRIKEKLGKEKKQKIEKIIYTPEELNSIISEVVKELGNYGISIKDVRNIHYGKKIKINYKNQWAELNVFYGKRGYTVVKTPKRGSSLELAGLAGEILTNFLK